MPFDGNPAKFTETKPDVFSLEGLVAWLEKQNPATSYRYCGAEECLVGTYVRDMSGRVNWLALPTARYEIGDQCLSVFIENEKTPAERILNQVALSEPHTYGAALDRARQLLAERT